MSYSCWVQRGIHIGPIILQGSFGFFSKRLPSGGWLGIGCSFPPPIIRHFSSRPHHPTTTTGRFGSTTTRVRLPALLALASVFAGGYAMLRYARDRNTVDALGGSGLLQVAAAAAAAGEEEEEGEEEAGGGTKNGWGNRVRYHYGVHPPPSREQMVEWLKVGTRTEDPPNLSSTQPNQSGPFDVLIIGAGATGSGLALECASRGVRCALLDGGDLCAGTSSRSTKLVHGGLRYLQQAVTNFDITSLALVAEGLQERSHMLTVAPFCCHPLPIALPLMNAWWELPYFYSGIKVYDAIAKLLCLNETGVPSSFHLSQSTTSLIFPYLSTKWGSIIFFDGQQNDSRFSLLVALTSASSSYINSRPPTQRDVGNRNWTSISKGWKEKMENMWIRFVRWQAGERGNAPPSWAPAVVANYCEVVGLIKDSQTQKIIGARVQDTLGRQCFNVYAKVVVNCTGAYADAVRQMSVTNCQKLIRPSAGVHLCTPRGYCSVTAPVGLYLPRTADDRVLFILPWESGTVFGTTDNPCDLTPLPVGTAEDVEFILDEVSRYTHISKEELRRDVKSMWSGIRPLIGLEGGSTKDIARSYQVLVDDHGLVSVLGGKWTTYRKMAQDALYEILRHNPGSVAASPRSRSRCLLLLGAVPAAEEGVATSGNACVTSTLAYLQLSRELEKNYGLAEDSARHLVQSYGYRARQVCQLVACPSRTPQHDQDEIRGKTDLNRDANQSKNNSHETSSIDKTASGTSSNLPRSEHVVNNAEDTNHDILPKRQTSHNQQQVSRILRRTDNNNPSTVKKFKEIDRRTDWSERLHPKYPFIKAEVLFACRYEMARYPSDVLGRRLRLAFLDTETYRDCLPEVVRVMGGELGWSATEACEALQEGERFCKSLEMPAGI